MMRRRKTGTCLKIKIMAFKFVVGMMVRVAFLIIEKWLKPFWQLLVSQPMKL